MMEVRGEETRDGTARTRGPDSGRATPAGGGETCDTTDSWLEIFSGLLHLPQKEKESIRDEIGSHLKERVRDLLLEGYNETNAIHAATRELGDAAELAKRFESVARGRTRRTTMHFAILGTGLITAASAGVLVLKPTVFSDHSAEVSIFQEAAADIAPPASVHEASLTISPDMTLREIVDAIADATDLGIVVDWGQMEEIGLVELGLDEQPTGMGLSAEPISALETLQLIQRQSEWFDWRFRENNLLELGEREAFDLSERVLASYDIAQTLLRLRNEYELPYDEATLAITQLITEFVEPELWEDNGGLVGQLEVVGGTLFISAPPRMHERTAWILAELDKQSDAGALLELQPLIDEDDARDGQSAQRSTGDTGSEVRQQFAVLTSLLNRQRGLTLKLWRREVSPDDLLNAQNDPQVQELTNELTSLNVQRDVNSRDGVDVSEIDTRIAALETEIRSQTMQLVERKLGTEGGALQQQIDDVLAIINHLVGDARMTSALPASSGRNAGN